MSIFVFDLLDAFVDRSDKDCPTVYQKRSWVQFRKDEYTKWDLPSGGLWTSGSTELSPIKRRA